MLSETQKRKLPPEIVETILTPTTNGDRRTLHMVWKVAMNGQTEAKRQSLFRYFAKGLPQLAVHIARMHVIYEQLR